MKKLAKILCGLTIASFITAFAPFAFGLACMLLNLCFGINVDFMSYNPVNGIMETVMKSGGIAAIPLFFLTLSAIEIASRQEIQEKGKELAEKHSAEELMELYANIQTRSELLHRIRENLRLMKKMAERSYSHNNGMVIAYNTTTLMPESRAFPLEGAEDVVSELELATPGEKYTVIPIAVFAKNDAPFRAIEKRDEDESLRLEGEMRYLECAIALKSTTLSEISIEATPDVVDIITPAPESMTAKPDSDLLMQTSG